MSYQGTVTVVTSHGLSKDNMMSDVKTKQFGDLMAEVVGDSPTASVKQAVSTKVSHAVHYGSGTWDKIPYSVEVTSEVVIPCQPTPEAITTADNMANQIAAESALLHLGSAKDLLEFKIGTEYYKELFDE